MQLICSLLVDNMLGCHSFSTRYLAYHSLQPFRSEQEICPNRRRGEPLAPLAPLTEAMQVQAPLASWAAMWIYNMAFVCDRMQSSREDVSPAWDSKPEQKRLVDLVLAHDDIADYIKSGNGNGNSDSSGTSREAIKKRRQRARKFLMIVELFGTTVLNAAPDVSVSRRVSFVSFTLGFVDGVFIFMRIPSSRARSPRLRNYFFLFSSLLLLLPHLLDISATSLFITCVLLRVILYCLANFTTSLSLALDSRLSLTSVPPS
jgi:hypothetical protein